MAQKTTVDKVKVALRISHDRLDQEIADDIDACLVDLQTSAGIRRPDENDPLILEAIKNHARANFHDDTVKAEIYRNRYEQQRAGLSMASGYGGAGEDKAWATM